MKFGVYVEWWQKGIHHQAEIIHPMDPEHLALVMKYNGSPNADSIDVKLDVSVLNSITVVLRKVDE